MPRNVLGGLIQTAVPITEYAKKYRMAGDRRPETYNAMAEQLP
jgi:hypothetical protein